MGIHPLPTPENRSDALNEARGELWLWAEALVSDRTAEWYAQSLSNLAAGIMSRKHCRLWRAVIHDQPSSVPLLVEDLLRTGATLGLQPDDLETINNIVVEELVDVVLCRFRASRTATKTFSLVLMSAMSCLGTAKAAA